MRDSNGREKGDGIPSVRTWIWIVEAVVVLAAGVHGSRLPSISSAIRLPLTPLDRTSPSAAGLWRFLVEVRGAVPRGASFTVQAARADDEMTLYMFSLGLLVGREALPSSYYGVPTPEAGRRARFVLTYGVAGPRVGRGRLVRETAGGAVYERAADG